MKKIFCILTLFISVFMCSCYKPEDEPNIYNKLTLKYDLELGENQMTLSSARTTITESMEYVLSLNGFDNTRVYIHNNKLYVEVLSENGIDELYIRYLVENRDHYEVSFRDGEDNLLATGEELLDDIAASMGGEDYNGYPLINLHIKDTSLLQLITTSVSYSSSGFMVVWFGFEEGYDSYGYVATNITTAKKVIYNAYVAEPLSDSVITVGSFYTYQHAKEMVSCINFFQLDFELSNLSSTYIEAN